MELPNIAEVKTADEAIELAKNWQVYASEAVLYYSEIADGCAYFEELANKFPELVDEFKENGII